MALRCPQREAERGTMGNRNEYDDAAYTEAALRLIDGVAELWDAGATEEHVAGEITMALDNLPPDCDRHTLLGKLR
jgi:hypothetical protein